MRLEPLGDPGAGVREAGRPARAPPARLIRPTLRPACAEGRDIRVDVPSPPIAPLIEWEALAPPPAADRRGIEATGGSTRAQRLALGQAALALRIAVPPCGLPGLLLRLEPWGVPIPRPRPCRRGWGRGRLTGEATPPRRGHPLVILCECIAQVTEQGKAISHWAGFWCPRWRPARLGRGALTAPAC